MIRILVVEPHSLFRRGILGLFDETGDLRVHAEASSATEGLTALAESATDVVVTELALPDLDGMEMIRRLTAHTPRPEVLVLTALAEDEWGVRVLQEGAAGFVSKTEPEGRVVTAVRAVAAGRRAVSPSVMEAALRADEPVGLSTREVQVAHAIVGGRRRAEIAETLALSPATVTTYRRRVLAKLSLRTDAELARYAMLRGLTKGTGR